MMAHAEAVRNGHNPVAMDFLVHSHILAAMILI